MRKRMIVYPLFLVVLGCNGGDRQPDKQESEKKEEESLQTSMEIPKESDQDTPLTDIDWAVLDTNAIDKIIRNKAMTYQLTEEEDRLIRRYYELYNQSTIKDYDDILQEAKDKELYAKIYKDIVYKILKLYNYKKIPQEEFKRRISYFYGIDLDKKMRYLSETNDFYTYIDGYQRNEYREADDDYQKAYCRFEHSVFIDLENAFVMKSVPFCNVVTINGMIHYEPNGHEINPPDSLYDTKNGKIVLRIDTYRILYRNLYMFHGSKSALVWLLIYDMSFFDTMLREYGFDKEPEANKRILKKCLTEHCNKYGILNPDYLSSCYDVFYSYDDEERLRIHKNLWRQIYELTDSALTSYEEDRKRALDVRYFEMLSNYLQRFGIENTKDRAELFCNFARMEVDLNKKHSGKRRNGCFNLESSSISYVLFEEEYLKEAEKYDYFGVDDFEEVLEVLKWDAAHDPQGDITIYEPFDYTTL